MPPTRSRTNGGRTASDAFGRYLGEIEEHPLLSATEEVDLAQTIERGREAERLLADHSTSPPLQRARLVHEVRAGRAAKQQFINSNLRLVVSIAVKYRLPTGMERLDLVQEGNLGLIRAVEGFDWRRGFKFSTYATWWIRQAVTRALAEKSRQIRIPAYVSDAIPLVEETRETLRQLSGVEPAPEEIARVSGLAVGTVNAVKAVPFTVSFDEPIGEGSLSREQTIADENSLVEMEAIEASGFRDELRTAIDTLPERERDIVARRFGREPVSYQEIGDIYGLTANRIRQLEKLAFCRLRHPALGLREPDLA